MSDVESLRARADRGDPAAQVEYGLCLDNGQGVVKDLEKAAEYFRRAADQGNADGQVNYGVCLKNGQGVVKDLEKAAEYYRRAADQGDAGGQFNYGVCLKNGQGVVKNLEKAAEYYRRVADQGNAIGQYFYGMCFEKGEGVQQNLQKAADYFKRSADQGKDIARVAYTRVTEAIKSRSQGASVGEIHSEDNDVRSCHISDCIIDADRVRIVREIGRGAYGVVHLVTDSVNGEELAQKTLNSVDHDVTHNFLREVDILLAIDHPCVLSIKGIVMPRPGSGPKILTEFVPHGSLSDVFRTISGRVSVGFWTHTNISVIICGIVLGMRNIHSHGVMHRDLKPANILLDRDYHARICDFGCSRFDDANMTQTHNVGTPFYMAPEMYDESVTYTTNVDVFSFGLILYEMIFGKRVFGANLTTPQVIRKCIMGERPSLEILGPAKGVNDAVIDIISQCWSVDCSVRPTFSDIIEILDSIDFRVYDDVDERVVTSYVRSVKRYELLHKPKKP